MERKGVFVNEALCFLSNKYDNNQVSDLKSVLISFYRDDELVAAKEGLAKAVQQCFRDINAEADVPRLPRRQGDNKTKQTVDDILKLFTLMDERKLLDTLPLFVAGDLSRIPFVSNDGFSMVSLSRRLEAMEQRLVVMEERSTVPPVFPSAQDQRDVEVADREDRCEPPHRQVPQPIVADSDACGIQSDADNDDALWSTKTRRNRPPRPPAQTSRQQTTNQASRSQQPRVQAKKSKVFGTCKSIDVSLKPGVNIIQKAVVHIDNLSADCTEALLADYLLSNDVRVLTCYKAKSWLREEEQDKVTAYRVCVPLTEREKIFDPQIWSEGVIIRNWRFKTVNNGAS